MSATEQSFGGDAKAPAGARHFARAALDELLSAPVPSTLCEDVELLISELVTNAVRAASPTVLVSLEVLGSRLIVQVTDEAAGWPEQREAGIHDTGGRGLPLVSAISSTWGVRIVPTGKIVWAELEIPAPPRPLS